MEPAPKRSNGEAAKKLVGGSFKSLTISLAFYKQFSNIRVIIIVTIVYWDLAAVRLD